MSFLCNVAAGQHTPKSILESSEPRNVTLAAALGTARESSGGHGRTVENCGELRRTAENCGELRRTVENCGELWRTVENCGELGDMGVGGAGWASTKSKKCENFGVKSSKPRQVICRFCATLPLGNILQSRFWSHLSPGM